MVSDPIFATLNPDVPGSGTETGDLVTGCQAPDLGTEDPNRESESTRFVENLSL